MGNNLDLKQIPSLTILVSSTDSYQDLWQNFFALKNYYWPDCPFPTVLVTDMAEPEIPNVKIIKCGPNLQWSSRMRKALDAIDSDYVCFLLEDFYITDYVKLENVISALKFMESEDVRYYKLLTLTPFKGKPYQNYPFLQEISSSYPYGISLMAAIWRKDFFIEKIGKGDYNPWKFEIDRLREEEQSNGRELVGVFDKRNILNITHMVVQGQILPTSLTKMRKMAFLTPFSRRNMSPKTYLLYNLKLQVGLLIRRFPILKMILHPLIKKYSVAQKNK